MNKVLMTALTALLASSALAADPAFPKAPSGKVTLEVWSWVGGLRASSDPIELLDDAGLALLRRCLTVSTPDRPVKLSQSFGGATTHFSRGTFNLTDTTAAGLRPHSYREGSHG